MLLGVLDIGSNAAQLQRKRAELDGVSRPRSRQILAGAVVASAAMKALSVDSVDVCPWALREGIVLHLQSLQAASDEPFDLALRPLTGLLVREQAGTARTSPDPGRTRSVRSPRPDPASRR